MNANDYIKQYVIDDERDDNIVDYTMYQLSLDERMQKELFEKIRIQSTDWSQLEFNRSISIPRYFILSIEERAIEYTTFPLAYSFLIDMIFLNKNYSYVTVSSCVDLLKQLDSEKNVLLDLSTRIDTDNPHHIKIGVASLGSGGGSGINLNKEKDILLAEKYEKQLLDGISRFLDDTKLQRLVEVIILEPNRNIRDAFRLEVQDIVNLYKNKL